jgi:pyruvyl transferase EpsO
LDAILDRELGTPERVAVLDSPYDANVGNHMMWLSICQYLRQRGIKLAYSAHARTFEVEAMRRAIGDSPVLFLGGVTVSRLWPHHADLKRKVAQSFRRNKLLSLPATMLFADEEDAKIAGEIFSGHPDVTMLARDPVSAQQARDAFKDSVRVLTAPDLAFRLAQQPRSPSPEHEISWLARDDLEGSGFKPPSDVHVFDWTHRLRQDVPRLWAPMRLALGLNPGRKLGALGLPIDGSIAWLWERASIEALRYGNFALDSGRVLVTDRLHPHVLAALRRQPCVLLPDRFGKNRVVHQFYTGNVEGIVWAETPEEALTKARELAARTGTA